MLDYHGDHVALEELTAALSGAAFADPAVQDAQARALDAVATEDGRALLGALVYHLLMHAASDGAELALIARAADVWGRGAALCDQLASIREDLEDALEHPGAADSPDKFNAAAVSSQLLANSANGMREEIDTLRTDALAFAHLPPHPRQSDRTTDSWDWGNLILARRTDAFVRSLFRRSVDSGTLAFAVGANAAYGANAAGSAYVAHTVGGPRRTHRFRDRLARNAAGSWLAAHHPAAISPSAMGDRVAFGGSLPADIEAQIRDALEMTFDLGRTAPIPDLQVGHARLLQHLSLLDGFRMPPDPASPGSFWMATMYSDPHTPPPSLRPQDVDVNARDGGGVAAGYGPSSTGSSSASGSDSSDTAKGCGIALLLVILVDLAQAFVQCIAQWAKHEPCTFWKNMLLAKLWEQDPPDPRDATGPENPNVTASQLKVIAEAPETPKLIKFLSDAHVQMWEAMDKAYVFLALTGVVYPRRLTTNPPYAQFTAIPQPDVWPHREEVDPAATYHLRPTSATENPSATPSPFAIGARPDAYVAPGGPLTASIVSLRQWQQIAADEHDSQNRDLDADRGFGHDDWMAAGSVADEPVGVVVLGYDEQ